MGAREAVLADFVGRAAAMVDRVTKRLDAEEHQARELELEEPVEDPPGFSEDAVPTDPVPPTGELHTLPPKDPDLAEPVPDLYS
jgi:hypothetical protein